MEELTKSQKSRIAIRIFKTMADALALRGYYKPSGKSGETMAEGLKMLSPEIYGSMNDSRIIELKGLEYVIDRLPRGIEECTRIILTAQEDLEGTSFEKIVPPKRRRATYRVSRREICFVITRGLSEIYDLLTHLTFLNIEAGKVRAQMHDSQGNVTPEWKALEETVAREGEMDGETLDQALWNLGIILGRTYHETRDTYRYLEENRKEHDSNRGLFRLIYNLGRRAAAEEQDRDSMMLVSFTPSLKEMIGHHKYGRKWAEDIKKKLDAMGLSDRPLHIISANLHSVMNVIYGAAATGAGSDLYSDVKVYRDERERVNQFAIANGMTPLTDQSGSFIDCQIIDTARLEGVDLHCDLAVEPDIASGRAPVLLVMDYAFGTQAYEVMDELLGPHAREGETFLFDIRSISIMGKAGILPGDTGDIMLASAHVFEGTTDNYIVHNDLVASDFDEDARVYTGPILTVYGTSLQNSDVLEKFQSTSWKAVGLEMEGGHYQKAICAAIIRGHIRADVKLRYAYYASDNPLKSGQTLAQGAMGEEGVKPTYMITRIILEKIFAAGKEGTAVEQPED